MILCVIIGILGDGGDLNLWSCAFGAAAPEPIASCKHKRAVASKSARTGRAPGGRSAASASRSLPPLLPLSLSLESPGPAFFSFLSFPSFFFFFASFLLFFSSLRLCGIGTQHLRRPNGHNGYGYPGCLPGRAFLRSFFDSFSSRSRLSPGAAAAGAGLVTSSSAPSGPLRSVHTQVGRG